MEGECHESGRVLMYQWKFKDLTERCSIMTEMAEFLGLKAFRFALKKVGGQDTKTRLYFICTNLHKIGYKVAKVSVKIKGKPDLDAHMNLCENELDHLQLFVKEIIDCEWQKQETFTFGVHVIETLENYRYQLSDILFTDQLWLTAKNKLWTDIEFSVQNHIFSAHRAILAARSPTLFGSIESLIVGSQIKIDHTEPLVFEMFLRFLYTGVFQVNNHRSVNEELLKLAERYKLSTLKSLCQLAVQDIDANQLTSFAMAMKPDFEICPKKPQLKEKTKAQLFFQKYYTVIECVWRVEELPQDDKLFTSDQLNFRNDGAFRAGLADHPSTKHSTLLSPQHFLYLACSHLEKTGTSISHVESYIDGAEYCRMERRGEKALYIFGRELYDLVAPSSFKFDILIRENLENFRYQLMDSLRSVDYWNMFLLAILTDAELQVGKKIFKVHRVIISSRSPVFTELFNTSTVESVTGKVRIDDGVNPDAFKEFLFFLYTGELKVSANSQSLLKLAEKYQVKSLIEICRAAIQEIDVDEISTSLIWL
ncbi:uncharacterized protein LOC124194447 isoform X1 [Daphnia pulex]|uniref:uncharacterized protein LOC124194447 isoform X1 n=1 Tax=Daphnia pulex TaxID=6669 RepID=UPI001EE11B84|nr:uncharacterized protein LOC124194447 isoform X1 [Daphnia pulex]